MVAGNIYWGIDRSGTSNKGVKTVTDDYTITRDDADKSLIVNKATAVTVTVPTHISESIIDGQTIDVWNEGVGVCTIAGAGGVTVNGDLSLQTDQFARLRKISDNVWNCEATGSLDVLEGRVDDLEGAVKEETDDYTLVLTDAGAYIRMNKATAVNLNVPTNASVAFPVNTMATIIQAGAGQVTLVGAGPPTLNSPETLKLRTQFSSCTIKKVATDVWDVAGDMELS